MRAPQPATFPNIAIEQATGTLMLDFSGPPGGAPFWVPSFPWLPLQGTLSRRRPSLNEPGRRPHAVGLSAGGGLFPGPSTHGLG